VKKNGKKTEINGKGNSLTGKKKLIGKISAKSPCAEKTRRKKEKEGSHEGQKKKKAHPARDQEKKKKRGSCPMGWLAEKRNLLNLVQEKRKDHSSQKEVKRSAFIGKKKV